MQWIFIVDGAIGLANIAPEKRLVAISPKLKAAALQCLMEFMLSGGEDYAEFKKRLVERFLPFNHRDLVRNELMSIKQYGSFDNFFKKFLSLVKAKIARRRRFNTP